MKIRNFDWIASAVAAVGLAGLIVAFFVASVGFRMSVARWAARDLGVRATLAARTLREALETGDMPSILTFSDSCRNDGLRFSLFSQAGGVMFDSSAGDSVEYIFAEAPSAGCRIRLGMPCDQVFAPFRKAGVVFVLAALVGAAGVLLFFLVSYRQRVRIRELARLEQFRRDFVADVSHEIKTPLTGIVGAADILADSEPEGSPRAKLLGMLKKEAGRLNSLAQGVLDLARIERGADVLNMTETDLSEIAAETVERLRPQADAAGVELKCSVPGPVVAQCDAQLVSQAVANLVVNAIRHSGSPDVAVSVARVRGGAEISVEDRGKGIPEEHAERVFERFRRVDPSRAAETGGAGLGLAIVRGIARLHGGDARLERVRPTGCRFTVRLPV